MADFVDFYGLSFEAEYSLFASEFEALPGVYVVYTEKSCLDIGSTDNLKESIETHKNTREWLKFAGKDEIFVAFHLDEDKESREDKEAYLRSKMNPLI